MSGVRGVGLKCLVCALVGLALGVGSASGEESSALGGTGSSLFESSLVMSGGQSLFGGGAACCREVSGLGMSSRGRVSRRRRPRGRISDKPVRGVGLVGRYAEQHSRGEHRGIASSRVVTPAVSGSSGSLSGNPLVVPAAEFLVGGQLAAAEEARLANPEAVSIREESRTKFSGLSTEQASRVDGEAFPAVIDESGGGLGKLPAGVSVVGYASDDAAQVDLPGGGHGVVESLAPIAVEGSLGQRVPVDLSLAEVGGVFEPRTPVVGVRIPKRLGDGVSLGGTGVSLTPVDGQGVSLGGSEGAVDGMGVFFANTQTDSDTIVKATTFGFETDTLLRSEDSPRELSFRVGLPQGGSLVQAGTGSGLVQVVVEGAVVAAVLAPSAQDAAGVHVPVSMSVSGDVITLVVDDQAGEYQFPVDVDPTVHDEELTGASKPTRWKFGLLEHLISLRRAGKPLKV
jgi:hypothetical protein